MRDKKIKQTNKIISILFIMIFLIPNFVACTDKKVSLRNSAIKELKENQNNAFTEMLYASNDKVIFYGDVGLVVYDVKNSSIYRAVNLKDINMNHIQGSTITIFNINEEGTKIIMYNDGVDLKDNTRYLYDVEKDKLEKTNEENISNEYKKMKWFEQEFPEGFSIECYGKEKSENYCEIDEDNICYLTFPSNEAGRGGNKNLKIIIKNKNEDKSKEYNIF